MTDLAARTCIPCRKSTAPLSPDAARTLAREIPDWSIHDNATRIERNYPFRNFAEAFAFVAKVAVIAEAADHHPDIGFGWGYARLSLQTHSIGGLHENDFIIAARCDDAFRG
jgi:4a-hydroxytetrahydrobiopterin dehydratase